MLTRNSSALSKSKTLLTIPLVIICILCFSKNAFSDDKRVTDGNKITYRGNVIEMTPPGNPDTVIVIDPVTGKEQMRIATRNPWPALLNGKKIYTDEDFNRLGNKLGQRSNTSSGFTAKGIKEYLLTSLDDELKQLKDGNYYIDLNNIIVDAKGAIVYFEYGGISTRQPKGDVRDLTKDQQDVFAKKITNLLLNAPTHIAATIDGKYVPSLIDAYDLFNPFTIEQGRITAL